MRSPENNRKTRKWENNNKLRCQFVNARENMRKHCQICQLICMWGITTDYCWRSSASAGARGSKAALNKAAASLTKASVCALRTNVECWSNDRNDRIRCREQNPNCQTLWQFMFLFMPICRKYLQNVFHFPSPNHKSLTRFVPRRNVELCILGTSGRSSAPCHQQWWKQMWRNHIYWHVEFLLNFRIYWVETAAKNGKTPFTKNNLALRTILSGLLAPNASRNGAWPWQVQLSNWVTDISRHPRICRFGAWQKHKSSCIKFRVTWQFLNEKNPTQK